jgi:hypothetical protein
MLDWPLIEARFARSAYAPSTELNSTDERGAQVAVPVAYAKVIDEPRAHRTRLLR